ncbi:hypothetical protein UFOVP195_2 [uncultured Caudovirales phage]|uniref:Uncharacterized protein n=1 Tax=uncultured Caudovirales phage TaxID=2100421 RepID=A0A6J7WL51_9CAUD|nr:hypothetical protein UFOVP195_2 [uncultured Caudovirales phage]
MAGVKISNLPAAGALTGTELVAVVQGGVTSQTTAAAVAATSGVTSFAGGTTGLTPASATSGAVTLAGTLAVANGGTNTTATPTAGAVPYGTGTAYAFSAVGTSGQVLKSNGASAPTWTTVTGTGTVTSVAATVPAFLSVTGSPITAAGTLAIAYSGSALPVANGGTNAISASITAFNNITGYTASGATGTTSTNLVFSDSPSLTGTVAVATKVLVGGPTSATFAGGVQIYGDATTFAPNALVRGYSNTTAGPSLFFVKTRGTTATSTTAVQSGDTLGSVAFYGADGTANQVFAAITGIVDGAVSAGVVPTSITFTTGTSVGTQRAVITSAGLMGIGTGTPASCAIVDVNSTTLGFKFPVMTTTQKNAIAAPVAGLVIFDSTLAKLCVYSGSAWQTITSV